MAAGAITLLIPGSLPVINRDMTEPRKRYAAPSPAFCPGYAHEPFISLCSHFPDATVYPPADFHLEWGPVFHRGRLDGSARVLVLGMVPTQMEIIVRRILVGSAGQRVGGFLARLGITRSYVMVNTFIYAIANSKAPVTYQDLPAVAAYRHAWLDALIGPRIEAVIGLGARADAAFASWRKTPAGGRFDGTYVNMMHPTQPESAAHGNLDRLAAATALLIDNWNQNLQILAPKIRHPDHAIPLALYKNGFASADLRPIPLFDLPAGTPAWMGESDAWAVRVGATRLAKRAHISVSPPAALYREWNIGTES